jgi:hypothetical protein
MSLYADTHFSHRFIESFRDNFLVQHVTRPTRYRENQEPSLLDLLLSNDRDIISDIQYTAALGKSDHVTLLFDIQCSVDNIQSQSTTFVYHKGNYERLRKDLSNVDWDTELDINESVMDNWNVFATKLDKLMVEHIPTRTVGPHSKKRKPLWINKDSMSKIKKKHQTWSIYVCTRHRDDHKSYVHHRNAATASRRTAKREFERKLSEEIKTSPKSFWKYVGSKCKSRVGIAELQKDDGTLTSCDTEKAEVLNTFFQSVFTHEDTTNVPHIDNHPIEEDLLDIHFSVQSVADILQRLNASKSAGPDGMHPRVLKECSDILSKPIYRIMRQSLDTGELPHAWKEGYISAIFKKGKKQEACNYRPISLTSVVCKACEKIVRKGLVEHMDKNNLFSEHQHGFRSKRSIVTQLLEVIDDWT